MFHHILVPVDGSARAEQAFPVAVRIARATGATLTLFRTVMPPRGFDRDASRPPEPLDLSLGIDITEAQGDINRLLEKDELEGIGIKTEVRPGKPAQQILAYAEEQQVDLIVMCSHGTTGFTRWLLGSVAQKVARHSPVPVLIVREGHPLPTAPAQPVRLLVPLDGSPLAEAVIQPAAQISAALSAPAHGSLHLVRVVEFITPPDDGGRSIALNEENEIGAEAYLGKIKQRLREGDFASFDLALTTEVVFNADIATALLNIAENKKQGEGAADCTMIAMATHGRGGPTRWLLGSIAERMLSATTMPMLIVRPKTEAFQE